MAEKLTPEQARKVGAEATKLANEMLQWLAEKRPQREVVLTALQLLIPHVCLQMGVSFEVCMQTLAKNMPTFFQKATNEILNSSAAGQKRLLPGSDEEN